MTFKTLWKICEQNDLEKLKKQNRKKLKTHKQQLFYKCAVFNKFELAKWLYTLGDIDVNYQKKINYYPNSEHLLTICGEYNYYDLAVWLISKGTTVITENLAAIFAAGTHGNLELVKLFYRHGSPVIYFNQRLNRELSVFEDSCRGSDSDKALKVVQWLYTIYNPTETELKLLIKDYDNPNLYLPHIKKTELYKWINHLISTAADAYQMNKKLDYLTQK